MTNKFLVVVREDMSYDGVGFRILTVNTIGDAATARAIAHKKATESPGRTFTIIQIIGHAVADLVRDIEP